MLYAVHVLVGTAEALQSSLHSRLLRTKMQSALTMQQQPLTGMMMIDK